MKLTNAIQQSSKNLSPVKNENNLNNSRLNESKIQLNRLEKSFIQNEINDPKIIFEGKRNETSCLEKKENIDRIDLENAYLKNTNRLFDQNKVVVIQHKDSYANYFGAKINEMAIPNIGYKKFTNTIDNVTNEKNKVVNTYTSKIVAKTVLTDQKLFGLSSDFEVEAKIKIPINAKIYTNDLVIIEDKKNTNNENIILNETLKSTAQDNANSKKIESNLNKNNEISLQSL